MTASPSTPVVIVGGGPTGITAAILLALQGVPSLVIERWEDIYPQPRAVHLDDEVYRILGKLGVADEFAAISRPALGLQIIDSDHQVLARFQRDPNNEPNGYPQANLFDQPDLERILRNRLAELPLATLRSGAEVISLTRQPDTDEITVDVRDMSTGAVDQINTCFVLGCDGANSLVRTAIGSTMEDLHFEQHWLVIDVDTEAELEQWGGVHQLSDKRAGTYMRIGPTRHRWEFQLLPGEDATDFENLDQLLPLIKPWTGSVDGSQLNIVRCAGYTFRAQIADSWRSGGVFLLGDAAHLTPPFIGQGMGAGLRDAYNLAWKLSAVLHGCRRPEEVLDSYQAERRPHALALIRNAVLIGFAMTGGGIAGQLFRAAALPRVSRMPGLGRAATTSETPRLHKSELISRRRHPRALEGRLCPNARIDQQLRVDDVGTLYAVITVDDLEPDDLQYWTAFPARIVRVDIDSTLGRWLKRGRSRAALIRPDSIVRTTAENAAQLRPS
ncbi:MAG TPA: bifunctional 3-(3-hydroxy-phenyl)propionate/3-hydroxycinnamic acid hydroxylase [Gordonia sp. (in: high G+C Gram-positive bacteria)]|uniref:bifunctional 3-(3-hydroxy-phenyl)propionate/3-hydroxycinnamic acid hydroxylase MhpA n=1 Tax=unclassified Gordonia (in: high G+C Gram-positive bacteria) TaxID=2657482 RepID=UPI0025C51F6F|nr:MULTISPECIES: bifunctional 3-(3-hydroxy-phenyl)propionate/3-hydroxycinnamic acid hydroxylase [unclassified Gordonia (in: high G+C Gram-positive bacteria)]HNP56232.1 bifunctional 3-(3-hydroxy-phenyl)propionate/3-hydroxycinnamic acid hydroxylase [Gordonia sp. (in: high G+C Gram-positive bacteria)]HRC51729.1 bifunctional 3-(3-hydroxy-phenyl)propionate/3-hydroxycinnamic acid hydroxylase [Gordonia sp. (in: high G+C Gram-positive bacteria)]